MKCKFCQSELGQDTLFCPNCGKDLSGFDKCVKCGELLDSDAVFCPYCGTEQPHEEPEESAGSRKWLWVSLIALVLAVGGGCFYFLSSRGEADSITISDNIAPAGADEEMSESKDPVSIRLRDIYDLLFDFTGGRNDSFSYFDSEYCSKSYNELIKRFNTAYENSTLEGEIVGPDVDHWVAAQDFLEPYMETIVSVSYQSDTEATAIVHIIDTGFDDSGKDVELKLVFENGDWFIDDFIIYGVSERKIYLDGIEKLEKNQKENIIEDNNVL